MNFISDIVHFLAVVRRQHKNVFITLEVLFFRSLSG
jgi:hypothetical protein